MSKKPIRCAIYTRKSTEEGLDKEFNTLEAQREACEAYIKSQMHEGWTLIPTPYDDGGYTGGNMDRPALRALMSDIRSGKVDNIVVYKVDRLSRSLNDFAQMVNVFDAHKVSFVSITQQFNTTTSMGRLTLNILLSFAQFEREVIGERVRDKIAASKRKGMWMGGNPPLGYDVENRKLMVNPQEAALVQEIFERHLEMGSAYGLIEFLNQRGDRNKRWVNRLGVERGGQEFCMQAIYKILSNPIYIGLIRHKENVYEGQHEAIISAELWDSVQQGIKSRQVERVRRNAKHGALLMGKCLSPTGDFYTPSYSKSGGKQHRYYIQKKTQHRIKGPELESLVVDAIRVMAREPEHWRTCWNGQAGHELLQRWQTLWGRWENMLVSEKQDIAKQVIERVTIAQDHIIIRMSHAGINTVLEGIIPEKQIWEDVLSEVFVPSIRQEKDYLEIILPARFEVYGRTQIALDAEGRVVRAFKRSNYNQVLVNALVKSYRWNKLLDSGEMTVTELAAQQKLSRTYISRIVNLMFLSPDVISGILTGTQPETLQLQHLMEVLPIEWHQQKQVLKFPAQAA